MKVLTASQMKQAEELTVRRGMSWLRLMENAGAAAAKAIREAYPIEGKRVAILCGQGNNGGDGYVIARKLKENGARPTVIRVLGLPLTKECEEMCRKVMELGLPIYDLFSDEDECYSYIEQAHVIVDAVFGTGFHARPDPQTAALFHRVNRSKAFVAAVDLPSGIVCDTGAAPGAFVQADLTVSFSVYKPCHFLGDGIDASGRVEVVQIGIPQDDVNALAGPETLSVEEISQFFPKRKRNSNKGDYGTALLVCGSYGMAGAAILAGRAAVKSGAGLVRIALPKSIYEILATSLPEAVFLPLPQTMRGTVSGQSMACLKDALQTADAFLFGPGLGRDPEIPLLLESILKNAQCPIVLDADGINALAGRIHMIEQAKAPLILTPHPGEMARLCGVSVQEVQSDRLGIATRFAKEHNLLLILKGAGTVIALPDGRAFFNPTGNPGMATAGSGDMLAGMLVAFLAQGLPPEHAAVAATWLHGRAGDKALEAGSMHSLTPTDMLAQLPDLFSQIER